MKKPLIFMWNSQLKTLVKTTTACIIALFFIGTAYAANTTVFLDGRSGPWDIATNPSYPYADIPCCGGPEIHLAPTAVSSTSGLSFTAGNSLRIEYVSGLANAGGSGVYNDANGATWWPIETGGPGQYVTGENYLEQVIGVFANSAGVIVGSPFTIGNGPVNMVIPSGATQLLLGFNDSWYSDNGAGLYMKVSDVATLSAITVTPSTPTINVGQMQQFTATGTFTDGSTRILDNAITPPSGLVSRWPGEENANDVAGTNNGTLVGGTTFAAGKIGQAFSFDGMDDYVSVPGTWGGSEATVSAWVKETPTTTVQAIVSSTAFEFVHLQLFNRGNIVAYTDAGVVFMPIVPQTSTCDYRLITFSVKSGDSRLYVNGELVGSSSLVFNTIIPTSNLRIGSGYEGGRFFKGNIDDVEIFDRALSASEVQTIYSNGGGGCGSQLSGATWSSSNTSVASIDAIGLGIGRSPGTSTITATSGSLSGSTILTVVNPNHPPVANAGSDQTVIMTSAATAITLNGSGSSDPDSDALTYTWTGAFGSATGANPSIALPLGSHTITLTVSDGKVSATDTVVIKVVYGFGGFLPPLTADSRTNFHLGSVLPVKFDLYDANGTAISTAVAHLSLQKLDGGEPVGAPIDAIPTSSADSGNLFRYIGGHYAYNLSTKPFTAGIWRIQATLDDGTVRTIDIGLTSK